MSATGPLYEVVETDRAIISTTTVVSLLAVLCLLLAAYALSLQLLPRSSSGKIRILFIWHLFDALTHFLLEGSFLYCVFFSTVASSTLLPGDDSGRLLSSLHRPLLPHDVHFLNNGDVMRGAFYGSHPFAKLWQEYARADARWGVADPGVVSLELLTVGLMGPLAVYICFLLRKGSVKEGSAWFWMTVVAASELYGGESSHRYVKLEEKAKAPSVLTFS